ncbi:MAG: hypothetical protein IPM71_07285 [Bacteroidota bacterium]|nr:MAG: hypothetical protein IPM71_07285 [Bacteroidota bacterium]
MKKILFPVLFALLLSLPLQAQVEPTGKYTIDLTFDPAAIFDAAAGDMFDMPMLKMRYFLQSDVALRAGLDYNFYGEKEYAGSSTDTYDKYRESNMMISGGIEKHFSTSRFQPYLGADLAILSASSKLTETTAGTSVETINPTVGYFGFGLYAAIGADFYLLNNLYIGVEFNPGIQTLNHKDTKLDGTVTQTGGKETSFGLSSASGLRIGFRF